MNPIVCKTHSRTMGLMLAMLGGLALTAPAQASVLACPRSDFGAVARTCALNRLVCRPIYLTKAGGSWVNSLLFFSVSDFRGAPSNKCAVPASKVSKLVAINKGVQNVVQGGVGDNTATLILSQENNIEPPKGRKLLCPASTASFIVAANIGVQNVVQVASPTGGENFALLVLTQTNNVKVPKNSTGTVVAVNVGVQNVIQSGGSNTATLILDQSNNIY